MSEFRMPSLGSGMEEGKLVCWRKQPGEPIARGEVIAEIETEKGVIEVECFETGVIDRLLAGPGDKVPVGMALALIRGEGEPAAAPAPPPVAAPPPPVAAPPAAQAPVAAAAPSTSVRASPMARRRARELGIALESLHGTGPHGAVTAEDVEAAARPAAPAPAPTDRERMRQAIAAAVSRSKREIPHFHVGETLDLAPALAWLEEQNRTLPVEDRILPGVLLLKAVALAARQVPELLTGPEVNVGVVVFLRGGGLIVPVLHAADRAPLPELMRTFKDVVERARAGRLRSSELGDGTISVTSLGERGAESIHPVIFPPQRAMVGLGAIAVRPWCVGGAVVPRPVVQATLAADHRVVDGHAGSRFVRALAAVLAEPSKL